MQHRPQHRRRQSRIGEDKGKHGRHIRLDHPRALGDAGEHGAAHPLGDTLGPGVRGHDGFGRQVQAVRAHFVAQLPHNALLEAVHRQVMADDARRARNNVLGGNAQFLGHPSAGCPGVVHAALAGGDVGILAVDDQRMRVIVRQMLAPDDDRRAAEQALGKHAHRRGARRGVDDREIQGVVLDADVLGNAQIALGLKWQRWCTWHERSLLPMSSNQQ